MFWIGWAAMSRQITSGVRGGKVTFLRLCPHVSSAPPRKRGEDQGRGRRMEMERGYSAAAARSGMKGTSSTSRPGWEMTRWLSGTGVHTARFLSSGSEARTTLDPDER